MKLRCVLGMHNIKVNPKVPFKTFTRETLSQKLPPHITYHRVWYCTLCGGWSFHEPNSKLFRWHKTPLKQLERL